MPSVKSLTFSDKSITCHLRIQQTMTKLILNQAWVYFIFGALVGALRFWSLSKLAEDVLLYKSEDIIVPSKTDKEIT